MIVIVPPSTQPEASPQQQPGEEEILDAIPVLSDTVRGVLVGLALGLTVVFGIALWLDPYKGDVPERRMGTHQQLGLPPCTFVVLTGYPCPSCGMTTSFALLIRGDVLNSLRANWVGTMLAGVCLLFIPWSLACFWKRQTVFIRSLEKTFTILMVGFMVLMLLRWAIVVLTMYQVKNGTSP